MQLFGQKMKTNTEIIVKMMSKQSRHPICYVLRNICETLDKNIMNGKSKL